MKAIKQISKILFAAVLIATAINTSTAQERKESFEKTFKLDKTGDFVFSCYDTDLKINTWDKDEVKLYGEIIIDGGTKDDQEKLIEIFKNPKASESSSSLKIGTNLTQSTIVIGPFKKITLIDGKTIRVKKYKAKYEVWMPKSAALNLESKYNNIEIANLNSRVDLKLYEVDLTLTSFKKGTFNMKYSSADIGTGETASFDVYECKLEIKDIKTFSANSKYSTFNVEKAELIAVGSYEDKFKIENLTNGLTGTAKYSNFIIGSNTDKIKLDVYESDLEAKNITELEYNSKYSTVKALDIQNIMCDKLYETNIYASNIGSISCTESKYDKFHFASISKSIAFESAYETTIKVERTLPTLESFLGIFKYGSVKLPLNSSLEFSLEFMINYGDVDFPKGRVKVNNMDKDGSKYLFNGSTSDNAKCKIKFEAYETDFNLE
jgi:hypothetical protein